MTVEFERRTMSTPTPVPANNDEANGFPQDPTPAASQPMTPMPIDSTPVMPNSEPAAMSDSQAWTQPAQPAQYPQASTPYGQAPYSQSAYGQTPAGQSTPQAPYGQPTYAQPVPTQVESPYAQPAPQPSYAQPIDGQYSTSSQALAERLRSNSMICLILGILGLVMIGLLGSIPAWVWGNSIIKEAAANGIPEDYVSNAKIGRILGLIGTWIWIIIVALSILFFIGVIMFGIAAGASGY